MRKHSASGGNRTGWLGRGRADEEGRRRSHFSAQGSCLSSLRERVERCSNVPRRITSDGGRSMETKASAVRHITPVTKDGASFLIVRENSGLLAVPAIISKHREGGRRVRVVRFGARLTSLKAPGAVVPYTIGALIALTAFGLAG